MVKHFPSTVLGSTTQLSLGGKNRTGLKSNPVNSSGNGKVKVNKMRDCRDRQFPQDTGLMEQPEMMELSLE